MQRPESNSNTEIDAFSVEMSGIFRQHQLIRRSTGNIRSLSLEKAYEVRERYIAERVSAGERVVGWKVGCLCLIAI
jgi:2-keto-4-pentenoate hydratase